MEEVLEADTEDVVAEAVEEILAEDAPADDVADIVE